MKPSRVAIELQKQQHFAEAEQLYARVLDVAPHHPDALHYTGLLAHQQGRADEAVALMEQSLALAPNQADWHSNYAIVLQSKGRFDDAIVEYRTRDLDRPTSCQRAQQPRRSAARNRQDRRSRSRLPNGHPTGARPCGRLHKPRDPSQWLGRTKEASDCFCKALTLRPKHRDARRLLALAHSMIGEVDEAVKTSGGMA